MPSPETHRIHIVLVATTHPGNIGASARAMKTMGVDSLRLVTPNGFPSAEVTARAAGADDILQNARVFDTVEHAVADCGLVLGSSARDRSIPWPELTPEAAAGRIVDACTQGSDVAVMFGRESAGLTNEELALSQAVIRIPTREDFSSLNLASAVQVVCYELFKAQQSLSVEAASADEVVRPANGGELGRLYQHFEQCMIDIGFLDPARPRRLMQRMKRLFNRARPDVNEYNILRGILTSVQVAARGTARREPGSTTEDKPEMAGTGYATGQTSPGDPRRPS